MERRLESLANRPPEVPAAKPRTLREQLADELRKLTPDTLADEPRRPLNRHERRKLAKLVRAKATVHA